MSLGTGRPAVAVRTLKKGIDRDPSNVTDIFCFNAFPFFVFLCFLYVFSLLPVCFTFFLCLFQVVCYSLLSVCKLYLFDF